MQTAVGKLLTTEFWHNWIHNINVKLHYTFRIYSPHCARIWWLGPVACSEIKRSERVAYHSCLYGFRLIMPGGISLRQLTPSRLCNSARWQIWIQLFFNLFLGGEGGVGLKLIAGKRTAYEQKLFGWDPLDILELTLGESDRGRGWIFWYLLRGFETRVVGISFGPKTQEVTE
jgi:hypothetical protein